MATTPITDAERRALDAMLRADWIKSCATVDDNRLSIVWEEDAGHAAVWLQLWGERLCVLEHEFNPMLLSVLAADGEFNPAPGAEHSERLIKALQLEGLLIEDEPSMRTSRGEEFFLLYASLLMDLDLVGDQGAVFGLFSLCRKYAPDHPTYLRPLPQPVDE